MSYTADVNDHGSADLAAALPAYEIGGELGRGAHGVVLAGRHRKLGRRVAIKQLPRAFGADPGVRSRFVAEARVLASLDHPHIVEVYDFVDRDGVCLLVMERLTGGTLWSYLPAGGFAPDVTCALMLATCAGLHHAHKNGIVHRDVKPENLMFTAGGTLKVTDLGIAKVVGGASTVASRAGEVLGTPAYISPEQASGGAPTPATDVYQAGTLLFELLSGRLPFPIDCDLATLLYRHVYESPPPLLEVAHGVPARIAAVTDRAIATSPADRYQSAEEFGIAIATSAAATWGPGWLARTNVPVAAGGPILAAAGGNVSPSTFVSMPRTVEATSSRSCLDEPIAGEYFPVHAVNPALRYSSGHERDHDDGAIQLVPARPTVVARESHVSPANERPRAVPPHRSRRRVRRLLIAVAAALVVILGAVGVAEMEGVRRVPRETMHATLGASLTSSSWRVLPSAPTARRQVASATWNGVVWLFGGMTNSGPTAKVEGFDPAISTWESGPDLPFPLHDEMAVVYRDEVVVIGGWMPNGAALDAVASNRVFALRHGAWAPLPPLSHARAAGAAAVVGDRIVVAGGEANGQLVGPTEVYDGAHWTDAAPMPTLRDHLAAASDGRYFYAAGGHALSPNKSLAAVERYDPPANEWTRLRSLRTPRSGLGAAIVSHELVTVGGANASKVLDTVEALDLGANKRFSLPSMPTPRQGLAVGSVGSTVYAIDGTNMSSETGALTTNEALDVTVPGTESTRVAAAMSTPSHSVAPLPSPGEPGCGLGDTVAPQCLPAAPTIVRRGTGASTATTAPTASTSSTTSTSTTSTSTTSTTTPQTKPTSPPAPLLPPPLRLSQ
jgi:non-specific serine/threonine protein kinase